jgi:hypothetical protein
VEKQQKISPMLFRIQVHGIGQVISDEDRHPDVGLDHAQSLGMVVLCPKRLIDSFLLVARTRWHVVLARARGLTQEF